MSDVFWSSLPATIAAVGALLVGLRNSRHIDNQTTNIHKIEKATNSMKDALVRTTAEASKAVGIAEGIAKEKAAQHERDQGNS
jgi:hypothetical protein